MIRADKVQLLAAKRLPVVPSVQVKSVKYLVSFYSLSGKRYKVKSLILYFKTCTVVVNKAKSDER